MGLAHDAPRSVSLALRPMIHEGPDLLRAGLWIAALRDSEIVVVVVCQVAPAHLVEVEALFRADPVDGVALVLQKRLHDAVGRLAEWLAIRDGPAALKSLVCPRRLHREHA